MQRLNKNCLFNFTTWLDIYKHADGAEKKGMATALILQTLNLSTALGAISNSENLELSDHLKNADRVQVLEEWLELGLPIVIEVIGKEHVATSQARQIGMYILVCLKGVNPTGDLKHFLARNLV
ncbi:MULTISPECIES: hypothetical protein [unclassified Undibacterium]|uniref:hypothetical protein n=1 Tax=unclassified Undibacterium TaxID=2630295 RepID=UPI002AC9D370|nr:MULTISPECIES: hypothetical protein [unclassified Undibacterium]MEB0140889.1 hypothetical protein [Undibacterium sp. CCC2.1]MEB0173858.1 hypothetical protein [Undibacterium sp. CCC1.1]MEB0177856.1 hypothetical protein [Undibacterium sp. CCC3.4]MEB0217077.1 hypothetical protein [Undibacterium sp. 5I2]WPX45503.1 hypothetical protein RHM61_09920 [Undibacterium sp. CCC3.4]